MATRNIGAVRAALRLGILLCIMLFLLPAIAGCNGTSSATHPHPTTVDGPYAQKQNTTPQASPQPFIVPTPTLLPQALHGPTNFVLSNVFTFSSASGTTRDNGGTTTQLDANTIQASISREFKHMLFVVDANDTVKVYAQGATSPIATLVTQLADGSTGIQFTQVLGSVTLTFACLIYDDQVKVSYKQDYSGATGSSDPLGMTGSSIAAAFTSHVQWVTANQIPTAPTNGQFQLAPNGGVALSWSAGQNASGYNVYRLISGTDAQFQLLTTVKDTAYTDSSAEALQGIKTTAGVAYAIFAVGSSGVENPSDTIVTVATH